MEHSLLETSNTTQTAPISYATPGSPSREGGLSQRDVEVLALLSLADKLENNSATSSVEAILQANSRLWGLFYDKAMEDRAANNNTDFHQHKLNDNIIKLANYVFKKTAVILDKKDFSQATLLARLNREIAEGLKR